MGHFGFCLVATCRPRCGARATRRSASPSRRAQAMSSLLTALFALWSTGGREGEGVTLSDDAGEIGEGHREAPVGGLLDSELAVAAAQVLQASVPGDDHPSAALVFETAPRVEPCFEASVIGLDGTVALTWRGHRRAGWRDVLAPNGTVALTWRGHRRAG